MTTSLSIRKGCLFFLACLWVVISASASDAAPPEAERGHVGFTVVRDAKSDLPAIGYVAEKSPAAEAGVAVGDEVVAVNNVPASGRSITELKSSVEGPVDTTIQLTLHRAGTPDFQASVARRPLLAVYESAAVAGDPKAQFYLGYYYDHGPKSVRDPLKAAEWNRKSAAGGYAQAQTVLGYLTAQGLGTAKDPKAAAEWYLKAANQDAPVAERSLALCYLNGRGVLQNDRTAFDWFYRSAQQDDSTAQDYLGFLYRHGRGVAQDDRLAFAWYYRSAVLNNPYGAWGLAYMYDKGKGVQTDHAEALKWYRQAAAGLPADQTLKNSVAFASLRAFLRDPNSAATFDFTLLPETLKNLFVRVFIVLAIIYLLGMVSLLFFSLRTSAAAGKLSLALGWLAFYMESQGVAFFGLFFLGTAVTASTFIGAVAAVGALPVILSSIGPVRSRLWTTPAASSKKMLLYSVGAFAAGALIMTGYGEAYFLITHAHLPSQPTLALLGKAKKASAWVTYSSVAILLPAAEEIIFRGYLFEAARRWFSSGNVVVITALLFSAIHFQWLYFVPLAGIGVILGWVRLNTGSLWLPVLLHMVSNGVSLALST